MRINIFALMLVVILFISACAVKEPVQSQNSLDIKDAKQAENNPVQQPTEQTQPPVQEQPTAPEAQQNVKEFSIIAKNWDFTPSTIKVNKGDRVILKVKSIDVDHGLAIAEYNINKKFAANEEVTIDFVADKTGTFRMYCSVYCGSGHREMDGELIVE